MSRLESLVFLWPRRVYGGKLQNLSFTKVSQQVVMSFCMAGMALCDIIVFCMFPKGGLVGNTMVSTVDEFALLRLMGPTY
jgi:hypothetical protein